ncbi:alpha/beta hydrolase [Paenibacillus filicis]|uniref:Alpha/beta hydrolase n=1 Tax=Paenibacillus gyeongsangnamensis TaxID=3388067 RepID=A0ABT4Q9R5_9BACL|nr:alpha/beta hydrolase [Paenibacillus filicis]MCZ8513531.1 alpha/beta hydrolase [Paenibacillus filicis]
MPYTEETITIQGAYPLGATLTLPLLEAGRKAPAILIVPGTGANDRDGNNRMLKMNLYKDLTQFLGEQGCIALRYDKRGSYASGGDAAAAGLWDLADDAAACADFLRAHPMADPERVFVLGHSEGAMLAPALFVKRPWIGGLLLIAGSAFSLKDISARQSEQALLELSQLNGWKGALVRLLRIPERARRQNKKIIERLLASEEPAVRIKGKRMNAKWFREHYAYRPSDILAEVTCPVLAVTGTKDIQVPPEHARLLAESVSGPSEWHLIPDMTHILKKTGETPTMLGLLKLYKKLTPVPLDPELLAVLADWLKRHTRLHSQEVGSESL